ncbi:hypothetical protein SSS_04275 [Sarcoptes scabiei]|nr:hypothetical protein SSS_04275 [Sarcoptes scabiei]KPL97671.1 hypothetical protein QR98_0002960 [Sarcoptes scabiei]
MIDQSNRADLGGSLGSASSAYSPDPNMSYLIDSSQQFRPPGMQGCADGPMGMAGHMGGMGGYSSINSQLRSPVHSQMLLPGHPHAAMMMGHPMGHPGIPQGSPYDSSGQHIMDIHAS